MMMMTIFYDVDNDDDIHLFGDSAIAVFVHRLEKLFQSCLLAHELLIYQICKPYISLIMMTMKYITSTDNEI